MIEFQKRCLPLAQFLIILGSESKFKGPESYDENIFAELPDKDKNPALYKLVVKHMIHGPCGVLNPANSCMQTGSGKNRYPCSFSEETIER